MADPIQPPPPPPGSEHDPAGAVLPPPEPDPRRRTAMIGAFAPGGWARRLAKLWGFLGFIILVLIWARHVVLPFVFAALIAYILSPVVNRLSRRRDGTRRLPRGLAIILCYI